MFFYTFDGIQHLPATAEAIRQRLFTWVVAALLLLGIGASVHLIYFNRTDYYHPEVAHFREACSWVKSNTPQDALIISRKPRLAAVWSDRKSWWYTNATLIPQKDPSGNPMKVTHIIVTEFPIPGVNLGEGFDKLRTKNPGRFQLLYRTPTPTVSVYALQES